MTRRSALLLVAVAIIPAESLAQRRPAVRPAPAAVDRPSFGAEVAVGTETDLGLGARIVFDLRSLFRTTPLDAQLGFLYYFPAERPGLNLSYWEVNGTVSYRIPRVGGMIAPYVGGGLNIARASADTVGESAGSNTEVGLNLLAGSAFKVQGTITPFAEARVRVGGGADQLVIAGGARFRL